MSIDIREHILEVAKTKIGTPYKQLDCSAYVRFVYKQFGVKLPRTAAAQAEYLHKKGLTFINKDSLKPGDTVYWRDNDNKTRYKGIHHTGIYMGDGHIIESRPSKNGVKINDWWGSREWEIILFARPADLIKQAIEEPEEPKPAGPEIRGKYTIRKGDTLSSIVYKFGKAGKLPTTNWRSLWENKKIKLSSGNNPGLIKVGEIVTFYK